MNAGTKSGLRPRNISSPRRGAARAGRGGAACLVFACLVGAAPAGGATVVRKVAESFESGPWVPSQYNKASGTVRTVDDAPAELRGRSRKSLELTATFSGGGFEFFNALPANPGPVPGDLKRVTLWVRGEVGGYAWDLRFEDGWGRDNVNGRKLQWPVGQGAGAGWKEIAFDIPGDWLQPVTIAGFVTHNWSAQNRKATTKLLVDHIKVETDLSKVDAETGLYRGWRPNPDPKAKKGKEPPRTPLVAVEFSSAEPHNVFAGRTPAFAVRARSWKPGRLNGAVEWRLLGDEVRRSGRLDVEVEDIFNASLPAEVARYGLYKMEADLELDGERPVKRAMPFAYIPAPRELTEKQKDASPYGLNVHGGRSRMVSTFRKAGIVWFRDYAFNFEWLKKAKGADQKYAGWPWYPQIVREYEEAGARVLACLAEGIKRPPEGADAEAASRGPGRDWSRELGDILNAFPGITHWELDNEYAGSWKPAYRDELRVKWRNYRAYHRKFAEIVKALGAGELVAVEQGRAGIHPELVRDCIESGEFAAIGVVNSHHYAGVEPPETNAINVNTGGDSDDRPVLFFDRLREVKRAGAVDGVRRGSWLTEFGWDTLAGKIVTPEQQAAYLQRGFMMLLAAGSEKGFWFFDLDGEKPKQFFDGCGLVTHELLPKLSLCSFAALAWILPTPEFVGIVNAGEGTRGYVFRNGDRLVASLWTIEGIKDARSSEGPRVTFRAEKTYDFLGNEIDGRNVRLRQTPVFAVGIDERSEWFRQTAYMLETPYLVAATAGDTVTSTLRVRNNRRTRIRAEARLAGLPGGWSDVSGRERVEVAPGESEDVKLSFRIRPDEELCRKTVHMAISEGRPVKEIPLGVLVRRPVALKVSGLRGEPGEAEAPVRVSNRSGEALDGTLKLTVPASWRAITPSVRVEGLKPGETRSVACRLVWAGTWREDEGAWVEFETDDGRSARKPLMPGRIPVKRAPGRGRGALAMDADLGDWPAACRVPAWVLGSTAGEADADACLAWSERGLYVGVEVRDSKVSVPDPRSFWVGDCLELFVDTRDEKSRRRYAATDHQFWLAPQADGGKVYVGRWKRGDEIAATQYDIQGVESASRRTAGGYVMECLVPARIMSGFDPRAGARLGLSLNLGVKGAKVDREVYWLAPKSDGVPDRPDLWGTAVLAE